MPSYPLRFYLHPSLSEDQLAMVDLIEKQFTEAGFSRDFAAMAVVNAYAESSLNPLAENNRYPDQSAGLFMLNRNGGMGVGMPTGSEYPQGDSRKDPSLNIARVLKEIRNVKAVRDGIAAANSNWRALMKVWVYGIERPAFQAVQTGARLVTAAYLFPYGVNGTPVNTEGAKAWDMANKMELATDTTPVKQSSEWTTGQKIGAAIAALGLAYIAVGYAKQRAEEGRPLGGQPGRRR
jgi:hypothetical protein